MTEAVLDGKLRGRADDTLVEILDRSPTQSDKTKRQKKQNKKTTYPDALADFHQDVALGVQLQVHGASNDEHDCAHANAQRVSGSLDGSQ